MRVINRPSGGNRVYIYKITNNMNQKIYIGQTNNVTRRWQNHKCGNDPDMVIARAIKKYGVQNFSFEILEEGLTKEEANEREKFYIKELKSLVPNGYNVSEGGQISIGGPIYGADNGRAKLTKEEAQYILDHRDLPLYVLYIPFRDRMTIAAFRKVYKGETYTNLTTETPMYPYNMEFSAQFKENGLTYEQILKIRQQYADGISWREVYKEYEHIYTNPHSFYNVYTGRSYKYIMPEVFSDENKKKQSYGKNAGASNPRSKLTEDDVRRIRKLHAEGVSNSKLYCEYPQVSTTTIRDIINKKTWKNLL